MKYAIRYDVPEDPHFSPWAMIVEDTRHKNVLTVQGPNPCEGDNLIGFEHEPQQCELTVHKEGWEEECIGMSPVFAHSGGMYSVPTYKVSSVKKLEEVANGEP